jgi:hypothetical protein
VVESRCSEEQLIKILFLATLLAAGVAVAGPIQYTLTAPAITTGVEQTDAFSLTFTAPQILTTTTDLVALGTLSVPNPFNANYPNLVNANLFPTGVGSLAISFNGPPGVGTLIGSMLASAAFDHVGTYAVNWQIVGNSHAGDSVSGQFTITDVGATVPEPSSIALMFAGLAGLVVVSRRRGWARWSPVNSATVWMSATKFGE